MSRLEIVGSLAIGKVRMPGLRYRLQFLLLCLWLGAVSASAQQSFKIHRMSDGMEAPCLGAKLVVFTVSQTRQDLIFRVGILNSTEADFTATRPLKEEEITLTATVRGRQIRAHPTTSTLSSLFPDQALRAHAVHAGLLTFAWGSSEVKAEDLGVMELQLPCFQPITLRLAAQQTFTPLQWQEVQRRSPLNVEVTPQAEAIAIFPMRLHTLVVTDDALELTLSFKNASRFPVKWSGTLGGSQSYLLSGHDERLEPIAVSESLQHRLAPPGGSWLAGEDNVGWIRFPLPNPLAAQRLGFVMPGYGLTVLAYNAETKSWEVVPKNSEASVTKAKVAVVLEEERTFEQLKQFWLAASQSIKRRDWKGLRQHFRNAARDDMQLSEALWEQVPWADAEFKLSEFQHVQPDAEGRLRSVRVDLRYTLAGLPSENLFAITMECDMQRDADGQWQVDFVGYRDTQPFWLLGYTQMLSSDHFLILYRPGEDEARQAELAARQLERSYARLVRTSLPLKRRYAAFAVSRKDDFYKLTGRDPTTYAGAASAGYTKREGKVQVINEALYLNDYRFFTLQRAWGKQDRQVTVQHELVHLALADVTRPWTPAWLTEGTAMHYAEQCDSFSRAAMNAHLTPATNLNSLTKLSHLGAITQDANEVMTRYQFSGETVNYLVRQHGEPALLDLYAKFAAEIPEEWKTYQRGEEDQPAIATARLSVTRRVLRTVLPSLSLDELDTLVRKQIAR